MYTKNCQTIQDLKRAYHKKKEIPFPNNSKHVNSLNFRECLDNLKAAGFTEINTEEIDDLITGWLKKDGSVKGISVNGKTDFREGQRYKYDSEIVVKYHTFAKKRK